jgi:ABC-type transporter Mla maintaining outer membrane lipid asymmetry permease subunit MlaE
VLWTHRPSESDIVCRSLVIQIEEIGWRSLPLIMAAGFALGVVLSMHTRGALVQFGAVRSSRSNRPTSFGRL